MYSKVRMIVGGVAMSVAEKTYKTSLINNRRYLGNKYKLLSFITGVVNEECAYIETVADIFEETAPVPAKISATVSKNVLTSKQLRIFLQELVLFPLLLQIRYLLLMT